MGLSITSEVKGGATVVRLDGDLDVYTAPRLKETLDKSLAIDAKVILDMTGVEFIDSTALGVLVGSLQLSQSNSCDFRLVIANRLLLKIFHITGFESMFSIYPRLEEALSAT